MRTNYIGHDHAYQRKRDDPAYAGWNTHQEVAGDWPSTWQPLMEKRSFPNHGQLLELGCGAGNVSIAFAQTGYAVTGVDIAPTAISWATNNAARANVNVHFLQGNVLELTQIADASFDVALDGRCLHCIIGSDRTRFFQAARRVLKVGGILAVCTMCNDVPDTSYFQKCFDPQSRCLMHDDIATRYIGDSNDIVQEVMLAGFRVLDVEVLPPKHQEDLADLQLIAERR